MVSFPQVSLPNPCICLSSPPYALHAPSISFFSILSPEQYWVRVQIIKLPRSITHNVICIEAANWHLRIHRKHCILPSSVVSSSSWSCSQAVSRPVRHIPLLCIQWKTPDDGQRNCAKHVEFHSKNKFEKLMHIFGFIIRYFYGIPISVQRIKHHQASCTRL